MKVAIDCGVSSLFHHLALSENVVYIPNEIVIFHRDNNDQQNHWSRGTQHFQTNPLFGLLKPSISPPGLGVFGFSGNWIEPLGCDSRAGARYGGILKHVASVVGGSVILFRR